MATYMFQTKEVAMKFIVFWEMKPEDIDKVIPKYRKRDELGVKTLYGPCHIGGQLKGFTIVEADDVGVLVNYSNYYAPDLTMTIYPIADSKDVVKSWTEYHK